MVIRHDEYDVGLRRMQIHGQHAKQIGNEDICLIHIDHFVSMTILAGLSQVTRPPGIGVQQPIDLRKRLAAHTTQST